MAVLLAVGYLGIDKLHPLDDTKLKEVPDKHKANVEEWLTQLELKVEVKKGDKTVVNPALADRDAYVLLYVCEYKFVSRRMPLKSIWYFAYRQCFVPGLNYFRKRHYVRWVSVLAFACSGLFFATVIGEVFALTFQNTMAFVLASVVTYTVSIALVLCSTIIWNLLHAWLPVSCEKLERRVAANVEFQKQSMQPPGA